MRCNFNVYFNVLRYKLMNTVNTTKNNIISTLVDCCVVIVAPLLPPSAAFVRYCRSRRIRLVVVFCFHRLRPRQFTIIVLFFAIIPPLFRLIVAYYSSLSTPHPPACIPIDCCVFCVGWCGLSGLYPSRRR